MVTERAQPRRIDLPDMSADMVASRRFSQSWRGYDQDEVKQFLAEVAGQVRAWKERYEAAEAARREAEHRAAHPQLDEAALLSLLGDQTAAILTSAHSAAAEIVSKAEANASELVSEAEIKAGEIMKRAESVLAERTSEAEAVANKILEDARSEAEQLLSEGRRQHDEMVGSAREQSEKALAELARKRRLATVQIEQLRAGRERLLEAYKAVRRTLEEVTAELQRADAEARAASQAVARQHAAEVGPGSAHPDDPANPGEDVWLSLGPSEPAATDANSQPVPAGSQPVPAGSQPVPAGSAERAGLPKTALASVTAPAQPAGAPVVRAPKVSQVAGEWAAVPSGQNAPVVARAAEFESVRIVREQVAGGSRPEGPDVHEPNAPATTVQDAGEEAGAGLASTAELASAGEQVPAGEEEAEGSSATMTAPRAAATGEGGGEAAVGGGPSDKAAGGAVNASASELVTSPEERQELGVRAGDEAGTSPEQVEDLFARIRAARAEATSKARKALQAASAEPADEQPANLASEAQTPPMGTPVAVDERALFSERDDASGRLESSLARKLKRALQDEQNDLLDRLRGAKGALTPAKILPSVEEHPDRFVDAGKPLLEEAAQAGLSAGTKVFGLATAATLGTGSVEDLADELGRAIAEPLRQRLEEALRSDGEPADVADAIGAAYREWKTQRIEAVARDQLAAAWARGAYLAMPDGTLASWVVDPSEGPCPDCEDNALAGAQPKGQPWPTGQLHPPAHPGCRCALAPESQLGATVASSGRAGRARSSRRSARAG